MKKDEFIKIVLIGGATQDDKGVNSLYVTTDRTDNSKVYIYVKGNDALNKPFFGLQKKILQYLENKEYLVILLDDPNKKAYVLDKQDICNIIESKNANKNGAYLLNMQDLNKGIEDSELTRFLAEEIKVLEFLDEHTISTRPLINE